VRKLLHRVADRLKKAVAATILSDGDSSRLYQSLVYKKQLAQSANANADTREDMSEPRRYALGEGLVGQCAADRQRILLEDIPTSAIHVRSGLVTASPRNVIALPVLYEGQVKAVIELASMHDFTASHLAFLEQLTGSIGVVLNTIEATMRTEGLLKQSQLLTQELQARQTELTTKQEELHNTNEELQEKAAPPLRPEGMKRHTGARNDEDPAEEVDSCDCGQTGGQRGNDSERHQRNSDGEEERPVAVQFLEGAER